MAITRWRNVEYPTTNFSQWIEDFFNDRMDRVYTGSNLSLPAVNVMERNDEFLLELAAPGMVRDDFNIKVENGVMTISAQHKEEKERDFDDYTRREFNYSTFERRFTLPENVEEEKINAKYENGVLRISIPKLETTKAELSRTIDVK
ncbi:MAG: Hsp20/alpha crystallin family protein [Saprospiraceae bacterium]|nr:Hsp20/alpha crystallin family protein [Saprospiraceae bacterium]